MSSKSQILQALQGVSLPGKSHPGAFLEAKIPNPDVVDAFKQSLQVVGAQCLEVKDLAEAALALDAQYPGLKRERLAPNSYAEGVALEQVEVLELDGRLGVAENGAIWLMDEDLPHRVGPFICQHLVLYLPIKALVPHLHAAYEVLGRSNSGFALFLSGPSKTADIEQSLVIGAHGARSLTVVLLKA